MSGFVTTKIVKSDGELAYVGYNKDYQQILAVFRGLSEISACRLNSLIYLLVPQTLSIGSIILMSWRYFSSYHMHVIDHLIFFLFHSQVAYPYCTGCEVHQGVDDLHSLEVHSALCIIGFYTTWKSVQNGVTKEVVRLHNLYPSYSIVVSGHSLGGAVATLAGFSSSSLCFRLPHPSLSVSISPTMSPARCTAGP